MIPIELHLAMTIDQHTPSTVFIKRSTCASQGFLHMHNIELLHISIAISAGLEGSIIQ